MLKYQHWHLDIYQQDKTASVSIKARNIAVPFSIYEQLKRHAQLS